MGGATKEAARGDGAAAGVESAALALAARMLAFCASRPFSRPLASPSLMMMKGRPYSSNARLMPAKRAAAAASWWRTRLDLGGGRAA